MEFEAFRTEQDDTEVIDEDEVDVEMSTPDKFKELNFHECPRDLEDWAGPEDYDDEGWGYDEDYIDEEFEEDEEEE